MPKRTINSLTGNEGMVWHGIGQLRPFVEHVQQRITVFYGLKGILAMFGHGLVLVLMFGFCEWREKIKDYVFCQMVE